MPRAGLGRTDSTMLAMRAGFVKTGAPWFMPAMRITAKKRPLPRKPLVGFTKERIQQRPHDRALDFATTNR